LDRPVGAVRNTLTCPTRHINCVPTKPGISLMEECNVDGCCNTGVAKRSESDEYGEAGWRCATHSRKCCVEGCSWIGCNKMTTEDKYGPVGWRCKNHLLERSSKRVKMASNGIRERVKTELVDMEEELRRLGEEMFADGNWVRS